MKKILFITGLILLSTFIQAQDIVFPENTDDSEVDSLLWGAKGVHTVEVYMEIYGDELLFDDKTKMRPDSIKQVQIHLMPSLSTIANLKLKIKQGKDFKSAPVIVEEAVSIDALEEGWNEFSLTNNVAIDYTKRIYIGFEIIFQGTYLPVGAIEGTNERQGWYYYIFNDEKQYENMAVNAKLMFLLKTIVTSIEPANDEITLFPWTKHQFVGDSVILTVKNIGKDTLTFFDVKYKINSEGERTHTYSDLEIPAGASFSFFLPELPITVDTQKYHLDIAISSPNGNADLEINNRISSTLYSLPSNEQRIILHEGFSSSTCGPCNNGNRVLKEVLNSIDDNLHISVKYQAYFPRPGDPYYTEEIGTKMEYYSIGTVPMLIANGFDGFVNQSYKYRQDILEDLIQIPAFALMSGEAEIEEKTVNLNVEINPLINNADSSDLRFFAVIVEKWTSKNVKTNGETKFYNVAKKFMTDPSGDKLNTFKVNNQEKLNYTYTFNGEYRLPLDARYPINFTKEHSVEDFQALMVVYWIQDYETGEIYQAGKADPNPGLPEGLTKVNTLDVDINIYPNPLSDNTLHLEMNLDKAVTGEIGIYDMLGKEVLGLPQKLYPAGAQKISFDMSDFTKGVYFVRFHTSEGATSRKLIITK